MIEESNSEGPMRITGWGEVVFALTMCVLGFLGFVKGDFSSIWLPVPKGVPAREVLAYLSAFIAFLAGIGLVWQRRFPALTAITSTVFLAFLLVWLALVDGALIVAHPSSGIAWACAKTAALAAAAWVLYVQFTTRSERKPSGFPGGKTGLGVARALYGLALIPFGIAHFTYLGRTVSMVPAWLPWPLAWAYFFGAAFIVAGVAIVIGVWARLAAVLSVVQLALFTLLVWVPVIAANPSASDWREFIVSWALTAAAWVVADSYRGMPWLATPWRGKR